MDSNHMDSKPNDEQGNDLNRLFELISLNDRFDIVVVPKTKRAKTEYPQIACVSTSIDDMYADDRFERKIIRLEKQIKDMTKKINTMDLIIHNQCIMKEQNSYIN